jgi:hypothetical protein
MIGLEAVVDAGHRMAAFARAQTRMIPQPWSAARAWAHSDTA